MSRDTSWHEARSIPVPETGCWLWLGANKGNGYGNIRSGGRNTTAHRRAYELIHGPQSREVDICHRCDTRQCINPDHLFVGSRADNMQDAKRKLRHSFGRRHGETICGEKGPGAKLTLRQVNAIRAAAKCGTPLTVIAEIAGVSADNIRKIQSGITWKEGYPCAA